jgi:sulfonate transport system substrate-binding protein
VESGAALFHRNAAANTWGVLNVSEAFAKDNPALVEKVLKAYEEARAYSLANPAELKKTLVTYTKLAEPVIERQLGRTELTHSSIGQPQVDTILAAGLALQQAGVIPADKDVRAAVDALIDRRFATASR